MDFIDKIKEFKLMVTSISAAVIFVISGYATYTDIYTKMNEDNKQVELTQISMLKSIIRTLEKNPCKTSRDDWAEYNMLFSQYHKLMKKHNPLLGDMEIKPMERLQKDSCKCYTGKGVCDE